MDSSPKWFLGAYAASATLKPWEESDQLRFATALESLPLLRGLEWPLPDNFTQQDRIRLPQTWDYLITLMPATMNALSKDPNFGLASDRGEGRDAALSLLKQAAQAVAVIHEHCGRAAVCGVQIHSAPRRSPSASSSSVKSLRLSLEEALSWDWSGAELILEHCDAFTSEELSRKGFLKLEEELQALEGLGIGMGINWGRSALERRCADGPLEHIAQVQLKQKLRSFIFSGTAVRDELYGDWQDNHTPIALGSDAIWEVRHGLLTPAEVCRVAGQLQGSPPPFLGLKIQPFPADLKLEARIACLHAQLEALDALWAKRQA